MLWNWHLSPVTVKLLLGVNEMPLWPADDSIYFNDSISTLKFLSISEIEILAKYGILLNIIAAYFKHCCFSTWHVMNCHFIANNE